MKKIFILFALAFVFFTQVANSQEAQLLEQSTDIGVLMGLEEGQVVGQGVEYSQLTNKNTQLTFSKTDAEIDVNGNKFANIIPQDTAKHPSFIELDKDGNPVKADFTVNEKGGKYIFGNTEITAPPNSRVFFDKTTGVRIKAEEGAEFSQNPTNLGTPGLEKYLTTIEGNDYKLPNGAVVSGRLGFDSGQAFVSAGDEVILDQIRFLPEGGKKNLYFDENFNPSQHKNENYYWSTGDKLEFQSCDPNLNIQATGRGIQIAPVNPVDVKKKECLMSIEILENNNIFNTDDNDKLSLKIKEGDGLIINKVINGEFPRILHKSSESGSTSITNDGLNFDFNKDKISMPNPKQLTFKDFKSGKFQSVALNIESDSKNLMEMLSVDSDGEFSIISRGEGRVFLKRQGFPKLLLEMGREDRDKFISSVEKTYGDSWLKDKAFEILPYGLDSGLSPDQSIEIMEDVRKVSGDNYQIVLEKTLPAILQSGLSPDKAEGLIDSLSKKSGRDLPFVLGESIPSYLSLSKNIGLTEEETIFFKEKISSQSSKGDIWSAFNRGVPSSIEMGKENGYSEKEVLDIIASDDSKLNSEEAPIKKEFLRYANPKTDEKNIAARIYNSGLYSNEYNGYYNDIRNKYGIEPIKSLPDLARYPDFQRDILDASKEMKINPYLIYSSMEQEGLVLYLMNSPYKSDSIVDTYSKLGIDAIISDLPEIRRNGYLEDFSYEGIGKRTNEKGLVVEAANIKLKDAARAVAAELKVRQENYLIPDLRRRGIDPTSLTQEELDWWTYTYYNAGQGTGRRLLGNYGINFIYEGKNRGLETKLGARGENVFFNSGRVSGTAELARKLGVFEF